MIAPGGSWANSRRSSRLSSDRIFAGFPRMTRAVSKESYNRTDLHQTKYELAVKFIFLSKLLNEEIEIAVSLRAQ
jgi:hypothetical protein